FPRARQLVAARSSQAFEISCGRSARVAQREGERELPLHARMRKALLATGLLVACSGEPSFDSTSQSIVNGQVDMGDPATVYLDLGNGGCTGTLVSPKTIVTAKHCLSSQMWAYFGTYAGQDQNAWIQVVHKSGHPQADVAML